MFALPSSFAGCTRFRHPEQCEDKRGILVPPSLGGNKGPGRVPSRGVQRWLVVLLLFLASSAAGAQERVTLSDFPAGDCRAAFSPDSKLLATLHSDRQRNIKFWEARTGKLVASLGEKELPVRMESCVFAPDGKSFITSGNHALVVWDVPTFKERLSIDLPPRAGGVVLVSPDGKTLIVRGPGDDETALLYDAATGKQTGVLKGHKDVTHLAVSPDGKWVASADRWLASADNEGSVVVWDLGSRRRQAVLAPTGRVEALVFSPDGKTLATGSDDASVAFWDPAKGKKVQSRRFNDPHDFVRYISALAFSPDGTTLAVAGRPQMVSFWILERQRERRPPVYPGLGETPRSQHRKGISCLAFSPDGRILVTGSYDQTVKLWNVPPWAGAPGEQRATLRGFKGESYQLGFSPDGKLLASMTDHCETNVTVWEAATGKVVATLGGTKDPDGPFTTCTPPWRSCVFAPDGKSFLTCGDRVLAVWDVPSFKERRRIDLPAGAGVTAVPSRDKKTIGIGAYALLCPDGKTFIVPSARAKETAILCDLATGKEIGVLEGDKSVRWLALSPDGKWLAASSRGPNPKVLVWDLGARKQQAVLEDHDRWFVDALAFSPDSKTLATGTSDGELTLWDPRTGKKLRAWNHTTHPYLWGGIDALAFSPDGTTLPLQGAGWAVILWDVEKEEVRKDFLGMGQWEFIRCVAFSPDGKTLATGSADKTVKLWDVPPRKKPGQ
jgi:WD40 repeat protein